MTNAETLESALGTINACQTNEEIAQFTNDIDFTNWSGAMVAALTEAVDSKNAAIATATTTEPRANGWYLQYDNVIKVLDRAIVTRHHITSKDIQKAPKLRETGEYVIDNYTGLSKLILKYQFALWNGSTLTNDQLAAAWLQLRREYITRLLDHCRNCSGDHHIQRCPEIKKQLLTTAEERTGKTREQAQAEIDELFSD